MSELSPRRVRRAPALRILRGSAPGCDPRLVWGEDGRRSQATPAPVGARKDSRPWPHARKPDPFSTASPASSRTSTPRRPRSGSTPSTGSSRRAAAQRARYLMLKLLERAREMQVGVPSLTATDYINTITPEHEPWFPGDEEVERRYRAYLRWNAAVMVHRAQRPGIGGRRPHLHLRLGGDALRGRLQPLLPRRRPPGRRRPGLLPGPRLPRHVRPRLPRGPPLRGPARRVPPGEEPHRRRQAARAAVLPAPAPHAGLLAVPDRVDGHRPDERHLPGAVQQVPAQPRHQGHQPAARLGVPRRRRDGRAGVARPAAARGRRGARQPHLRHQLQPAAARRPGARQRQDHPGARGVLPRRRLERHQGRLGPRLGPAARRGPRRRAGPPHEHHERRRLPDLPRQRRRVRPRALLRPRPAHPRDGQGLVRRGHLVEAQARRPRLPQGVSPPTRPRWSTPASRPSSSRRRSRATASAATSPAATRRTR